MAYQTAAERRLFQAAVAPPARLRPGGAWRKARHNEGVLTVHRPGRAAKRSLASLLLLGTVVLPGAAAAQPASAEQQLRDARAEIDRLKQEVAALRDQYDARLAALEKQLAALTPPAAPAPAPEPTPDVPPPAPATAAAPGSKIFNPDIAVVGNFLGAVGDNANSIQPSLALDEVEASFQAVVDPYARADFFLAAGPEGLEIEEGFVTFNTLPGALLLKAGKMRAQFGKVNTLHSHGLSWTDRPLVTQNLVGGDEGISESGLSLSRLITNPLLFLEATGEIYYGASEMFQSTGRSDLVYVARLRGYRDLTEATNLDFGGSLAYGPSPEAAVLSLGGDLLNRLIGLDATFRYRPLQRARYRRFLARTELVWSQPRGENGVGANAFGVYGSGEYQFARRWDAGARYDRSAHFLDASAVDTGGALFLTYRPSEFSQLRGQYRHIRYGDGVKANEFLFQFLFSIGAHGAHVF
jgi:hypothetical protein